MKLLLINIILGISHLTNVFGASARIDPAEVTNLDYLVDNGTISTDPRHAPEVTEEEVQAFLKEFGYLTDIAAMHGIANRMDHTLEDETLVALKKFQNRVRLPETGMLDDDTKRLIAAPRCGVAELNSGHEGWTKKSLTYKIRSFPSNIGSAVARKNIRRAFEEWSKYIDLNIAEVAQGNADIYISSENVIHKDRLGTECRFSGNSTVAHAFFPEIGDIHYNSRLDYSPEQFFSATLHEIGHTLGLEHTNSRSSIMFPIHIRYHTKIPLEDREVLLAMYGARRTTNQPRKVSLAAAAVVPSLCSLTKIDTILNDALGATFVLAGEYYFPLSEYNPEGRPIATKWPQLPSNIDAAFTCRSNRTFFFKGSKMWVYADDQLEAGYPKDISEELPGLPNNMSTVYLTRAGSLIAVKGKYYWFYNPAKKPHVSSHFPRLVYDFRDMPVNMDAALHHTDGRFYFFKGRNYFTLNTKGFNVESAKPLDSKWFRC